MDNGQCSCPSRSPVDQLFAESAAERARDAFDFDIDIEASGSKFGAAFDDANSAAFAVGPPPLADDASEFGVENYIILMVGAAVYAVVALRRYWTGLAEKRRKRESKLALIPPPLRHRIISSNSAVASRIMNTQSSPPPKSTLRTNEDSDAGYASPVIDSLPHPHVHSTQSTARSTKNRRRVSEEASGSRHFHYTNHRANRKSANRNRHMLQESMLSESDFDAAQVPQRVDPAGAHSDYASDTFQISKQPELPSANTQEPSIENAPEKPIDTPAVVDTSFEFPKRLQSSESGHISNSPPKIAHDPSLTGSSRHTSSNKAQSQQQTTTDTESKSNLSNSLKTTMTFEHSIRLKDGDDESGSLTSSTDKHQGSISGLGSFWRRSFSRPPSVHESSLGESPTGGGILPKLNIFKRKSNADLVSLATGANIQNAAVVPCVSGDGSKSPIIPASPIATMMKGFWPTKQSAVSSSSISKQTLEPSTSESIVSTLAAAAVISTQKLSSSVPTLKLPKPGRKDKSKADASLPVEISSGKQELRTKSSSLSSSDINKSIKSGSESKRFWSKSKSKKESRNKLQTDGMASKDWSTQSGEHSVAFAERLVSDFMARTEVSLSSSPSASYANAATSVNDSNSAPFDPTIPYHDEEARNWVDVQRYSAEVSFCYIRRLWETNSHYFFCFEQQRGSMESEDKHNMFNRLKWQSGGRQKTAKGLSRDHEISGSSSTNSASKFFTLRKRTSNETMKSEFIRLAATSKPFTPSYELPTTTEPTYHLRDQFTPSPSSSRSMNIGPSPTGANYPASDYGRMLNHISGSRNYQLHYEQYSNPNYIHPNTMAVSDSDDGSFILKSKRRSQPHSSFVVEPIQRPNSATPSINSAPGSNRKTRSIGEIATTPIASSDLQFMSPNGSSTDSTVLDSPLYSPFFSGFEIPMTQRPSPSFGSSAASSFAQSQLSRGSRHHHYHHHHHFYHHSGALTEGTPAISTSSHHTDTSMSPLVNLPLANVKEHESDLRDSFKRLRKLSADAGLYTHQLLAAQRDSVSCAGGRGNAISNRNKLSARSTGSLRMEDENEWNEDQREVNEDDMKRNAGFGLFDKEDGFY
ncbi:hypothetical protein HDU81_002793 [Chytriomyces hyalinus]|nr:hypothetical protein HDU81_002793 [Chytriomyces hyalinus]